MIPCEDDGCPFAGECPGCCGPAWIDTLDCHEELPLPSQQLAQVRIAYDLLEPWDEQRVDDEALQADLAEARAALAEVLRENNMEVEES